MTEATRPAEPKGQQRSPAAAHPVTSAAIVILIAAIIFGTGYAPLYSRTTPKLGDFPFFYWYLLVLMPVTSFVIWIAALLQRRLRDGANSDGANSDSGNDTGDA